MFQPNKLGILRSIPLLPQAIMIGFILLSNVATADPVAASPSSDALLWIGLLFIVNLPINTVFFTLSLWCYLHNQPLEHMVNRTGVYIRAILSVTILATLIGATIDGFLIISLYMGGSPEAVLFVPLALAAIFLSFHFLSTRLLSLPRNGSAGIALAITMFNVFAWGAAFGLSFGYGLWEFIEASYITMIFVLVGFTVLYRQKRSRNIDYITKGPCEYKIIEGSSMWIVIVSLACAFAIITLIGMTSFPSQDGHSAPAGSWQSMSAVDSRTAIVTFGASTRTIQPMDIKVFVKMNDSDAGWLIWDAPPTSVNTTLHWEQSPSGASAVYHDNNPSGNAINSGDYIILKGLKSGTTYRFTVFYIPYDTVVPMAGVAQTLTTPP